MDLLRAALVQCWGRHGSLRSSFEERSGEVVRVVHEGLAPDWSEVDASGLSDSTLRDQIEAFVHQPFRLHEPPRVRVRVYARAGERRVIALVVHHIVGDYSSLGLLLDELRALYEGALSGRARVLAAPRVEFSRYVDWQARLLGSEQGQGAPALLARALFQCAFALQRSASAELLEFADRGTKGRLQLGPHELTGWHVPQRRAQFELTLMLEESGEVSGERLTPGYWSAGLRNPVLYLQAVELALQDGFDVFLEIGSHPAIGGYTLQTARERDVGATVLASSRRGAARRGSERDALLRAIASLYVRGVGSNFAALYPAPVAQRDAPAYTWQRESHWLLDREPAHRRLPLQSSLGEQKASSAEDKRRLAARLLAERGQREVTPCLRVRARGRPRIE